MKDEFETIYENISRDGRAFKLEQRNGIRDYTQRAFLTNGIGEVINREDKLMVITASRYPFTMEDLGMMIEAVLRNKVLESARQNEMDKLYPYIRRAFTKEGARP